MAEEGHTVHSVLIAEAVDIAAEYYLSFLLDRANRTFLSICTVQGGMEIEEVAHSSPEAVARVPVSPLPCWPNGSGPCSPTKTPRWSRSTRWRLPRTARCSRSTAR